MAVGLKIEQGDYHIREDGKAETVSNNEKCLRDFGKMLKTDAVNFDIDPNNKRYNPYYGIKLRNANLLKGLPLSSRIDVINDSLKESVSYYIKLQEQRTNLSVGEIITDIQYIVYADPKNSQRIIVNFKITNGSGNTFNLEQYI